MAQEIRSTIDPNLVMDRNHLYITLIRAQGTNHAQIIIEEIDGNGHILMRLAQLNGFNQQNTAFQTIATNAGLSGIWSGSGNVTVRGEVTIRNIPPLNLRFDARTQIWVVDRDVGMQMINAIQEEQNNPNAAPRFHLLGEHIGKKIQFFSSVATMRQNLVNGVNPEWSSNFLGSFVGGNAAGLFHIDNCFTWARDKLAICGIQLQMGVFEALFHVPLVSEVTDGRLQCSIQ